MEKRYSIDDKSIHFMKGYVYALIGNPDHPYVTSTDHTCFLHSWWLVWKNLRNWLEFWYYVKVDSQRAIIFINKYQQIWFNIREE